MAPKTFGVLSRTFGNKIRTSSLLSDNDYLVKLNSLSLLETHVLTEQIPPVGSIMFCDQLLTTSLCKCT